MALSDGSKQLRLVVLASGSGTLLQSVLDERGPQFPIEVVSVIADRPCVALDRAATAGIDPHVCSVADFPDRQAWNDGLADLVAQYRPDWILSAGFMKILGPSFVDRFPGRIINTHPALLPNFPGGHAVRDALEAGVDQTGCTVHLVDHGVDTGPIIDQRSVDIGREDSEESLHERIKIVERRLLISVLTTVAGGTLHISGRKVTHS